ncbi:MULTISPECIES: TetR/AcrR family transcriptional regulator [Amycolatopsis]|uniref:TetR/AcrR family transcriptional regulator n=1 Tax=Amycolatopsis thermalba TaxID=944492 RepID=A0ABY4NXD0_9PSEU|nr:MULTISPECIES: TetR/AcrR family transcriptional regulator [Amycolatopsis]OXM72518.1 TetR family transcriptional regulator [Amycolatopsis sp. KNN50.9b]UQS24739.1 TetR/AcrR family transcriptional regulator [Amycolatopsis thermalba]
MPKTVDHAQRRAQIAEALVRVAAREGLHAVTMRAVAAEAGISLRLVQYYFATKAQLMLGALRHLERESHQRWAHRLAGLPEPVPPREFIEAFLVEALPTDERSRVFHLVGTSYAVLAMTDPELAHEPFIAGVDELDRLLTGALTRAQADGQVPPDVDVAAEVARLLALNHGLGTSVLIGQRTTEDARSVLRYHLDQLFGRS